MIILKVEKKKYSKPVKGKPKHRGQGWFAWSPKNKRWYASKKSDNARPFESEEVAREVIKQALPDYKVVNVQRTKRVY